MGQHQLRICHIQALALVLITQKGHCKMPDSVLPTRSPKVLLRGPDLEPLVREKTLLEFGPAWLNSSKGHSDLHQGKTLDKVVPAASFWNQLESTHSKDPALESIPGQNPLLTLETNDRWRPHLLLKGPAFTGFSGPFAILQLACP